ncbi:MAG: histidinol-phosphatase HisJ family protein [Clostridia bacterium]
MTYLCDYHLHSNRSVDGKDSVREMCDMAVRKGLKEIAFTEDFEPTKEDEEHLIYDPVLSWKEICQVRQEYRGRLKIRLGLELGHPQHFPRVSEKRTKAVPFDYILGSAHKFKDGRDVKELDYEEWPLEKIVTAYLKELKSLPDWGLFDCVGHLDLFKRYSYPVYRRRISLLDRRDLLEIVLRQVIDSGKGLEVNTSGLRCECRESFPGEDVLSLYRRMGGEIITVGSDAHRAEEVGSGIREAIELIRRVGFRYITVFENRKPSWISLEAEASALQIEEMQQKAMEVHSIAFLNTCSMASLVGIPAKTIRPSIR